MTGPESRGGLSSSPCVSESQRKVSSDRRPPLDSDEARSYYFDALGGLWPLGLVYFREGLVLATVSILCFVLSSFLSPLGQRGRRRASPMNLLRAVSLALLQFVGSVGTNLVSGALTAKARRVVRAI